MIALALLIGTLSAQATPLESAEFYNTAHTLDKGAKVIHPLFPSTFGVSDGVNLETTFLGWFGGPNVATEIGFVNTDSMAVSAEAIFSSTWDFSAFSSVGGQLNYTSGGPLTNRFNASGGVIQNSFAGYNSFSIPISLGYDIVSSETTTVQFTGASDISYFLEGGAAGSIGVAWNKGWESYRIRLGINAAYLSVDEQTQALFEELGLEPPNFLPLPEFQMWWRL